MNGKLPTFVRVSTLDGHSNQNAGFSPADMHAACYQPKTTENRLHYVQSLFNTTENRPLYVPLLTDGILKQFEPGSRLFIMAMEAPVDARQ